MEGHDVMEVASPEGFAKNPAMVLDFYNQRRRQLKEVSSNSAHFALAELEDAFDVTIITQNVDDLHERAGSSKVIHLHGELLKMRSTHDESAISDCDGDIKLGDLDEGGHQLRPHIVWFGDSCSFIGKSGHDYAVSRSYYYNRHLDASVSGSGAGRLRGAGHTDLFYRPQASVSKYDYDNLTIIPKTAVIGVPALVSNLIAEA